MLTTSEAFGIFSSAAVINSKEFRNLGSVTPGFPRDNHKNDFVHTEDLRKFFIVPVRFRGGH